MTDTISFDEAVLKCHQAYEKILISCATKGEDICETEQSRFEDAYSRLMATQTIATHQIEAKIKYFVLHESDHVEELAIDFLQQIAKDLRTFKENFSEKKAEEL